MIWQYEKFRGDMAIYAICPVCGFTHCPSRLNCETMLSEIIYQYNYCPICGEYLFDASDDDFEITWNERDVLELMGITEEGDEA